MKTIEVDTRQQDGKHKRKHAYFEEQGYHLLRTKLPFGDYRLVGGTICVDTKRNIRELAGNLRQDHERFKAECVGANEAGYQLVVLVENTHGIKSLSDFSKWYEPLHEFKKCRGAKVRLYGKPLAKVCETMHIKYGVMWAFCSPKQAGEVVLRILEKREKKGGE